MSGISYCFGCGAHGDVLTMLQDLKGLSFIDAVRWLSRRTGYVPDGLTDEAGTKLTPVKTPLERKPRLKPDGRVSWQIVTPVPDEAAKMVTLATFTAKFKGKPPREACRIWKYLDGNGNLLGVDARYEYFDQPEEYREGDSVRVPDSDDIHTVIAAGIDGDKLRVSGGKVYLQKDCQRKTKDVITWTFCKHIEKGFSQWRMKAWSHLSPLYGLDRLANNPDLPVIITEGCKAADAANEIDGYIGITWRGGCKAIEKFEKTDWSPLAGRNCYIWPDADKGGREAAWYLHQHLRSVRVNSQLLVETEDLPKGWDLADVSA